MLSLMQVLAVEQRQKRRVLREIFPGEFDQPPNAVDGIRIQEVEAFLCSPDPGIGIFQDRKEEGVFAAEVIVEHPLWIAPVPGDPVDRAPPDVAGNFVVAAAVCSSVRAPPPRRARRGGAASCVGVTVSRALAARLVAIGRRSSTWRVNDPVR